MQETSAATVAGSKPSVVYSTPTLLMPMLVGAPMRNTAARNSPQYRGVIPPGAGLRGTRSAVRPPWT